MKDIISELLESGMTADEIFALAQKKEQALKEEKANSKAIAEGRANVAKAVDEYIFALTGEHMGAEEVKYVEDILIAIEEEVTRAKKKSISGKKNTRIWF